jgi:hypothetical protein
MKKNEKDGPDSVHAWLILGKAYREQFIVPGSTGPAASQALEKVIYVSGYCDVIVE